MTDGIIQVIREFGIAKCIGATLIVVFFVYCVTSIKFNSSKGSNSSSVSSEPSHNTEDNSGVGGV